MSAAREPEPTQPPPPPRLTTAIVSLIAAAVGVVSFLPWHLETCDRLYRVASVHCEHTHYPAPVLGIGAVPVIALGIVVLLGTFATWRPTKSTWRTFGWAAFVTGVVAYVSLGFDRHEAVLDATEPGTAAWAFDVGCFVLAGCGLAVMGMARHLSSERLPRARVRARG